MDSSLFHMLVLVCALSQVLFVGLVTGQTAQLSVDASSQNGRTIPDKMFGIFFEVSLLFNCWCIHCFGVAVSFLSHVP